MVPERTPQIRREVWRQVVIVVCLLAPGGSLLWVPLYAAATPRVLDLPWTYAYQYAWVLLTPVLMMVAYFLRQPPTGRDLS